MAAYNQPWASLLLQSMSITLTAKFQQAWVEAQKTLH